MKRNFKYKNYIIKIYIYDGFSFINPFKKIDYEIHNTESKETFIYNDKTNYMDYKSTDLLEIAKENIKEIINHDEKLKYFYTSL